MSTLTSPRYDRDTSVLVEDVTYQWSNPDTDPEYYQSSVTTGLGSVDPTIFSIIRRDDKLTIGNYFSFFTNGRASSPHKYEQFETVRNTFRKNLENLVYDFNCPWAFSIHHQPFWNAKYSPGVVSYGNYDGDQRFLRNFSYNGLVLLPKFNGVAIDGSTYTTFYNKTYNEMMEYEGNIRIYAIRISTYKGDLNSGEGPSQRYGYGQYHSFLQIAGSFPEIAYETGSWSAKYQYPTGTYYNGVFLVPINFDDSYIFNLPQFTIVGSLYQIEYETNDNFTTLLPYDLSDYLEETQISSQYPNVRRYTVSTQVATTMIDRLGYVWAKSANAAYNSKTGSECDDPDIRCSVIDPETNTITETVLEGTDISDYAADNPDSNFNWDIGAADYNGSTIFDIRDVTPVNQPTVEPAEEINLNEPVIATNGGTALWALSQLDVDLFFTWMWDPSGSSFDDIVKGAALLGNNPMDSLISLKMFPINIQQHITYEMKDICFGRVPASALTDKMHITSSNVIVLNLGSFYFNDTMTFGDFRDYEPYSDYSLYIPFCGIVPLQAIECINSDISIQMIIDLITGACTAVIFTGGVPYKYVDGMIGIEVPLTGRNLSGYANTVMAAALGGGAAMTHSPKAKSEMSAAGEWGAAQKGTASMNLSQFSSNMSSGAFAAEAGETAMLGATGVGGMALGAAAPAAIGLAFGIAGAAIGGAMAALSNSPQIESKGSNTPACSLAKPLYPYIIARHSDCWIPAHYDALYGRPCQLGGKIGDFVGFCTFGNLKLDGITATTEEKNLISEVLTKGVFL